MVLKLGKPISRAAASTAILLAAMFLAGYVCLFYSVGRCTDESELIDLGLPAWMVHYTKTIPIFLGSQSRPEVLLMGSSLVLTPAHYVEAATHPRGGYACNYFENELKEKTGKKVSVTNVGVIAAMASDQYSLLKTCIETGKKPAYIIFGLAPRDFIDNTCSLENSPTQQVLACYRSSSKFFPEALTEQDVSLCLNMHKITLRRWVKKMRNAASQLACTLYHRQGTIAAHTALSGNSQPRQNNAVQVNLEQDVALYERRYNPPNFDRLKEQTSYLSSMLKLCQQERIPVLLVNMPVTEINRNLIDATLLKTFENNIGQLSNQYHCAYLNLDGNNAFASTDNFADSVHLAAIGGKKFFDFMSDRLVSDSSFSRALQAEEPAVAERAGKKEALY